MDLLLPSHTLLPSSYYSLTGGTLHSSILLSRLVLTPDLVDDSGTLKATACTTIVEVLVGFLTYDFVAVVNQVYYPKPFFFKRAEYDGFMFTGECDLTSFQANSPI